MLRTALCLLTLCLVGCAQSDTPTNSTPAKYRFLEGSVAYEELASVRAGLPFEKLELTELTTWDWNRTTVTLWRDGRAQGPDGTGEVSIFEFGELCYLLERLEFDGFDPEYPAGSPHHLLTVRAWRVVDQEPIEVVDVMGQGPSELWTIQRAIAGVASRITWSSE